MADEAPKPRKSLEDRERMTELQRIRHSCAHIMATAVLRLWPDAMLDIGPPTDEGFYYDFDLPSHRFSPEDFAKIESEMQKVVKENQVFEKSIKTRAEAAEYFQAKGQKFKVERLADIPEGEAISFYQNGEFVDLCAGPHVMRTGNVKAFKLLRVASAYYRGNEKNPQLQRLYGTAFENKTTLEEWVKQQEEAKKRDHRKIGAEMGLFAFNAELVGPGMALWLPKGTVLIEELEKLAKETEFEAGYQRVRTPHLAKEKMYLTSGHLPLYAESMYPPIEMHEDAADTNKPREKYYLKPMNCPHHHQIFAAQPRSYRDLPLRLAEYGTCYRYEQSGELFGLMRVRCMQMNDAHIYCTEEQFAAEFKAVNDMYLKYFKIFGIDKYLMRYSTHDPAKLGQKFVDAPELWKKTEDMVRQVLNDSGINYVEVANEAAFYGPKIDVQVWSAIGREFTIATNQVDFAVPPKFGLTYRKNDNTDGTPLCIHRAPLGTHERFIGFLIEHYAGNFPLWLAPEQVRILPMGDAATEYGRSILQELRAQGVRVEIDDTNDKIGGKIRNAEKDKVNTMFVLGQRETEAGTIAVRQHGKGDQGVRPRAEVVADILQKIKTRAA
ncbi:MAG TPA: threonine--tRNA ligase [Verrucomicrobiae bacterium]|nr:threonine--tRNA ligase [Verrucomicrobiae bacterium]